VSCPLGRRLVRLDLGPVALAFLGTPEGLTLDAMRPIIECLAAHVGPIWPVDWLAQLGAGIPDDIRVRPVGHSSATDARRSVTDAENAIEATQSVWEVAEDATTQESLV
jgi:hypothetical protein